MFDQQIMSEGLPQPVKGKTILLVPANATIPDDVGMMVFEADFKSTCDVMQTEELPVILKIDAEFKDLVEAGARLQELSLKTLQGLPCDYPSYWQISFSALPKITYQELRIAGEASEAKGGSGIPNNKLPKAEFKPVSGQQLAKVDELADKYWDQNNELD